MEVNLIIEHLKELKVSFIRYYDLNPSDDRNFQNVINVCVNYFNDIINDIHEISLNKNDCNDFFSGVYPRILELDNLINNSGSSDKKIIPLLNVFDVLHKISNVLNEEMDSVTRKKVTEESNKEFLKLKENTKKVEDQYKELALLSADYKHKDVHKIYENDAIGFKSLARRYEITFYTLIVILFLYFLGLTIYLPEINIFSIKISFPNKIHGNLSTEFYIQKFSLLILSTTLLAFLLKRSFMNRRLADDAYRTSKELIALPRYMKDLPQEMQDKIHFDLAYKYFGNGIHHESYTGGENLMHENIKANTDFIKAVKDLSPKAETPKVEVSKVETPKADKEAA
ncbi:hypothetical protein [Acinetobacter silvestris]|nr:hypothetical protein [Acinetobacter silvestris]